jgi:hypothetical protein
MIKYGDNVNIVKGFYSGNKGQVKAMANFFLWKEYLVTMDDSPYAVWVCSKDLENV